MSQCAFWCVASFYKVRYEHIKRHMNWACNVFVSNFLGYVSAKNDQNLIRSDKYITKIKRVTFLRHSVHVGNPIPISGF